MNVPDDLRFAPSHEWFRASDGAVGISDHAQAELSDVVYVDLPKPGTKTTAGRTVAVIESVKAASDIYAPVTGEVIETNPALESTPSLVNTDPYGEGWLFKLKVEEAESAGKLLDAAAYRQQLGG
jgi:glycine cleavage system H protein